MRLAAVLGLLLTVPLAGSAPGAVPDAAAVRPNIIFILTDDLDAAAMAYMPKTKALITDKGSSFSSYFLNVALCCPSRATTLRGQYSQNSKVRTNSLPEGGYERFQQEGHETSTIGTWLEDSGYRTAYFGKYLNGYPGADKAHVPPGWTEWASPVGGSPYGNFNYQMNENGVSRSYGSAPGDYMTDVLSGKAVDFIKRSAGSGSPFFIHLATYAPHSPATPATRHQDLFPGVQAPRTSSFNEADVSDKPEWIRLRNSLTNAEIQEIDAIYRKRLQSLQAVDEMTEAIFAALTEKGLLDSTYVFFTSDNGYHLGQHRLVQGKAAPYEEDIRVPLLVRGPAIAAGSTTAVLAGNVDLAATWADLAGVSPPSFLDGRSLARALRGEAEAAGTGRTAFLIQHWDNDATNEAAVRAAHPDTPPGTLEPPDEPFDPVHPRGLSGALPATLSAEAAAAAPAEPQFQGIRTKTHTYVEYVSGEKELYELATDPAQLTNLAGSKASSNQLLLAQLSARLAALKTCAGAGCRVSDAASEATLFVPVAAHATGKNGSFFQTDLTLFNPAASGSVSASLSFLPADRDNTGVASVPVSVPARRSLLLPDVVASSFGSAGTGSVGGVLVNASGALAASSRTYNTATSQSGSFGVGSAGRTRNDAMASGILLALVNQPGTPGFRSNAAFLNPGTTSVHISLTLRDGATGSVLGAGAFDLLPLSFHQVNDVFEFAGVASRSISSGYLEFRAGAPVFAFATVVDNLTGDGTWIDPLADAASN